MRVTVDLLVMRVAGKLVHAEQCREEQPDCVLIYPRAAMPDLAQFMQAATCYAISSQDLGRMVADYMKGENVRFERSPANFPSIGTVTAGIEVTQIDVE